MFSLSRKKSGFKVLHVDNEDDVLKITKRYLEKKEPLLSVSTCIDPEEAVKFIRSGDFDCVISDYMMPSMTGFDLAEKVREFSSVPFILYTGQGSEEVALKAFSLGIDDYIRKEFHASNYDVLLKRVLAVIHKHRAETELRETLDNYVSLFNSIPLEMLIIDCEDFTILEANEAALRDLGLTRSEVVGQYCYKVTHHLDSPCAPPNDPCPIKMMLETGEKSSMMHIHFDGDGNRTPVRIIVSPLRGPSNRLYAVHISEPLRDT